MKTTPGKSKTWQKTNIGNLYAHKGGGYYYRVTVGGKQIWESPGTKLKSVAESPQWRGFSVTKTAEPSQ